MRYANKKVVVALSGGVDSAAAALLALQANCQVIGATLDLVPPEKVKELIENTWTQNPSERWEINRVVNTLEDCYQQK